MRTCVFVVLAVAVLAVLLAGCGGDSNGLSWAPYTPPSNVVSSDELQDMAVHDLFAAPETLGGVVTGDVNLLGYGRIPALSNVLFELANELFGDLGALLPLEAQKQPADWKFLKLMTAAAHSGPPLHAAQANGLFFDWTDPDTGIHWTGQVLESNGSLIPQLHGVGPDTDCLLNLTFVFELGTRVRLTGAMQGNIQAEIDVVDQNTGDTQTLPGRAVGDTSLDLNVNAVAGRDATFSFTTNLGVQFQLPAATGGGWSNAAQSQFSFALNGTYSAVTGLTATLNASDYEGSELGGGLYWSHHTVAAQVAVGMDADGNLIGSGTFTDDVRFSDGMTGQLALDGTPAAQAQGGIVTGYLRDAAGNTLATISGSVTDGSNPVTIHWANGTDEPVDWLGVG